MKSTKRTHAWPWYVKTALLLSAQPILSTYATCLEPKLKVEKNINISSWGEKLPPDECIHSFSTIQKSHHRLNCEANANKFEKKN